MCALDGLGNDDGVMGIIVCCVLCAPYILVGGDWARTVKRVLRRIVGKSVENPCIVLDLKVKYLWYICTRERTQYNNNKTARCRRNIIKHNACIQVSMHAHTQQVHSRVYYSLSLFLPFSLYRDRLKLMQSLLCASQSVNKLMHK